MRGGKRIAISLLIMGCMFAAGKDKKKILVPDDVLAARTVLVLVDPDAGVSLDDPLANRKAQEDVEKALMKWGRFTIAMNAADADLIISVRKGNGRVVEPTVGGGPMNGGPAVGEPTDSGLWVGGRPMSMPDAGERAGGQPQRPAPRMEAGQPDDMFAIYRGRRPDAMESPAVWRYSGRDVLRSPGVPAVEEFRKLIAEAEKQKADRP